MKNELEVLKKARQLIDTPDKWTRQAYARNENGDHVDVRSNEAVSFCVVGAVEAACYLKGIGLLLGAIRCLHRALPSENTIAEFNDNPSTTHEDVLALFDRAIASLSK